MKLLKTNFTKNTFFKTYILILIPISILVIFLLLATLILKNNYRDLLKESYSYRLESIYKENEASVTSITQSINSLSQNENFMNFAFNTNISGLSETNSLISLLKETAELHPLIDSIAVVDRSSRIVYSTAGKSTFEAYFYEEYKYLDYSVNYWKQYKSPLSSFQILSPTTVSNWNMEKSILPIVFTCIDQTQIVNPVIVNLSVNKLLESVQPQVLTPNSKFILFNKEAGRIFDRENSVYTLLDEDFYTQITNKVHNVFDYTDSQRKKNLIISYSPSISLLGYTFAVIVPYADITSKMSQTTLLLALLGIIAIIATLIVSYLNTRRIYNPIKSIASLFKHEGSPETDDTIDYIRSSIIKTLSSNQDLSENYAMTLPLVQEKYLINLLNSNEHYNSIPGEASKNLVNFKHKYFCSIIIKLRPTDEFYSQYSSLEYNSIQGGLYNIIKAAFNDSFDTFVIPSETDTLYVLLNLENDECKDEIITILNEFEKALEYDSSLIKLHIGLGGIYADIEGLKRSHIEAMNTAAAISGLNQLKIKSYDMDTQKNSFIFRMNTENNLFNYLLVGKTTLARELFSEIIHENVENNVSEQAMNQLYVQIINIIFRVMRIKDIPYDINNTGDIALISEITVRPLNEIFDTVCSLINTIDRYINETTTAVDINSVIDYISKNYNLDLGLETLADRFNTSPKYLSKLIKDNMGISFISYLTTLRIEKSKELLKNTNKKITDIYLEVGFNNRNTFIRAFKKEVGITPSEYKKQI